MATRLVGDLILRNRHFLDQFAGGQTKKMISELKKAQEDILKALASKPDINKLTKGHYRAVLAEVTSALKVAYSDIEEITLNGMEKTAQLEYHSISNAIRSEAGLKQIKASAPNMGLPEKALKQIISNPIGGFFLSDWVGKMKKDHQFSIQSALTQGLIRGHGMDVIARGIRRSTNLSMVQARTLARTSIMDASNRALEETYKELSNYILGYRWLATLDSVTCEECASMDGVRHKNYDDFRIVPLAHPQCRCVISPVTEFDEDEVERPAKVWDDKKKKFVYQKVSSKEKYSDWFDRQNDKFKKDYLGPGRFKLYKDNNLKFKDFVGTRDGRIVLTNIKDLKAKYGMAVEKKTTPETWTKDHIPQGKIDPEKYIKEGFTHYSLNPPSEKKVIQLINSAQIYAGTEYDRMRHAQRNDEKWFKNEFPTNWQSKMKSALTEAKRLEELVKVLPNFPTDKTVYRGLFTTTNTTRGRSLMSKLKKSLDKGYQVDLGGLSSFTSNSVVGRSFTKRENGIMYRIKNTEGTNNTSITFLSRHQGEAEVLFSKDNKFKVIDITEKKDEKGSYTLVDLESIK